MVLPKYFLLTARKILILPKSSKLGGAIAPPAPPAGTAMTMKNLTFFQKFQTIRPTQKYEQKVLTEFVTKNECTFHCHTQLTILSKSFYAFNAFLFLNVFFKYFRKIFQRKASQTVDCEPKW